MAPWLHGSKILALCAMTYIVPDTREAEKLTNIKTDSVDHAIQAAHHFLEQGVKNACIL